MKAIVNTTVCPLYGKPGRENSLVDEVLYGMTVEILDQPEAGWLRVRTHYRYEGIVPEGDLICDRERVKAWEALPKKQVRHKNFCDVLSQPKVQGWIMKTVPKGGLAAPVGRPENGWQQVVLADGRTGYVPAGILEDLPEDPERRREEELRGALVEAAMSYRGTHYRWGGKSPMGIDCSGLVSMAYMLCGILIYRDADIREGFPIHRIALEDVKPGDLLFFPGHVAMYIGQGRYCHSTARAGADGFTVNSLRPEDPEYRADLAEQITQVGSWF